MSENGTTPERMTIEIDGTTYESRQWDELTTRDRIKFGKTLHRLEALSANLNEYFDLEDDDDDDDDPPEELIEQFDAVHLRMVRFGFPDVPKDAWKTVSAAQIADWANAVAAQIRQDRGLNPTASRETTPTATSSGRRSRGSRATTT